MRNERSLSGVWGFQVDPHGDVTVASLNPDRHIQVPLPWQAAFPDLQRYSGYAWYSRSFDLEEDWLCGEVLLHFGAVDYWCQVYVNGRLAGEHEGGYTPFTLPVKSHLHAGRNEVALRVYDPAQRDISVQRWPEYGPAPSSSEPPFDANDIPHGKQEWYVNVGGIWQDVTLTAVPRTYIEQVSIRADIHAREALVTVQLGGERSLAPESSVRVEVRDGEGGTWEMEMTRSEGEMEYEARVLVEAMRLWDMSDPYLYTASAVLSMPGGNDEMVVRFGFREIATEEGRLLLNGEPIFLLSVLDQDLYPDTIYTVPSVEYLRDGFQKAKDLGFNCLRCHIKPPDPRYLDLADEMGLLVWAEIPSWRTFYPKGTVHRNQLELDDAIKKRAEQTLVEMVKRDFNHPSLVIWTMVNEDWGTALPLSAADREWAAYMYDFCKGLDPTRLVVDNSACAHPWGPNVHVKSDIDDFHIYANIPDGARSFAQTIEQFGLRPLWTYSSHGEAERTGREPLILSEFGNWGLPSLRLLRDREGRDPRWFDIGPWWSPWEGESGWPSGVEERFHRLGLETIWRDCEEFLKATQWHQFAAMKFEIEVLRRQEAVAGYVLTELTDAYWESNGLLDFDRNPKVYHGCFAPLNAPNMLVPQTERYAYWDDQKFVVRPHLVRYTRGAWEGGRLRWSVEDGSISGEHGVAELRRCAVETLELQGIELPRVDGTRDVRVELWLEDGAGETIASNHVDLLVIPSKMREHAEVGSVAVITRHNRVRTPSVGAPAMVDIPVSPVAEVPPDSPAVPRGAVAEGRAGLDLESTLHALGYDTAREISAGTRVAVSNYPDASLLRWVREGGDLLFLSSGTSPFFWVQPRGMAYGGNWITSYSWIRPEIHRRLKASNPLKLEFMHIIPPRTILGLPVEDASVQGDFLSGMVSGWVRHPAVHTVQFRYGEGRVIMTTFALEENLLQDPAATAMFHDLIEHLCSDDCQPTLRANY